MGGQYRGTFVRVYRMGGQYTAVPRYFFITVIGYVGTFSNVLFIGTVDTFLAVLLDISVTFLK